MNPVRDGAVLPILNLNGYKIANPTILARSREELEALFLGYGYKPYFVEGGDPTAMHQKMADTLERAIDEIRAVQRTARQTNAPTRPRWRSSCCARQGMDRTEGDRWAQAGRLLAITSVPSPTSNERGAPEGSRGVDAQLPARGAVRCRRTAGAGAQSTLTKGARRMSANPHANGGLLREEPSFPTSRPPCRAGYARHEVAREHEALGEFLRDVMRNSPTRFRVFGPDETASNRLQAIYEVSKKIWMADMLPEDADGGELARDGRVMEMLSEHTVLGWLEGICSPGATASFHLRGVRPRHRLHVQPARQVVDISKNHVPWRAPRGLGDDPLSSTVWRQDHNGFYIKIRASSIW